jgi:hypothetical protein
MQGAEWGGRGVRQHQPLSLTPALSRWERGKVSQHSERPNRPGRSPSRDAILPLPEGEGRGEGEGHEHPTALASRVVAHHSTPIIMQFSPLPMPSQATRWPGLSTPRSSARAAVTGNAAVPMLPRKRNVV